MKLVATLAVIGMASLTANASKMGKCKQIPKGAKRRYSPPRTIERGDNQPAAVDFLMTERANLMEIFALGERPELSNEISEDMSLLGKFAAVTDDQYLGQIFKTARENFNEMTLFGQQVVKQNYPALADTYRDNTQRIVKLMRDVTYSQTILRKMQLDEDITEDVYAAAARFPDTESKIYQHFLDQHLAEFLPMIVDFKDKFGKAHVQIKEAIVTVLENEKQKSRYRQLVNELPLVYQFFNDNIDFIEMQNVDKDLGQAIAGDILYTLATESGDKQIASMINRNMKFVKTLMTDRAMQQQKQKVVSKVMGKNKELKAAVANEAEFNRLVAEAEAAGQEMTKEMEKQIWQEAIANVKQQQEEQLGNQSENYDKSKHTPKQGMTRYEHIASIMGLMPDELAQSISDMVADSCPELNLVEIDTAEMKATVEEQDDKFLDQLIKELHDVCDMFGLIDESKVITKVINGVEVQIYEADWAQGEKVQW